MRAITEAPAGWHIHLQSPPPVPLPPPVARCDARTCPWWPYSDSKDFRTNASIIVIILLALLSCVLAFVAVVRHFHRRAAAGVDQAGAAEQELPKVIISNRGDGQLGAPPTAQVFVRGMKLAGEEAECAICLSEFVDGEGIKVLNMCNHGFHVECIQIWLVSHSSCPTCRSICLPISSSSLAAHRMYPSNAGDVSVENS